MNKSFLESIFDLNSLHLHDFKVIQGSYSPNYEIHNSKFLFMAMVYNFHVLLYLCFLCLMVTTIMHSLHFILCSIVSAPYSYPTKVISSSLAACSCSSLNWEILRHSGSCFILRHFSLVSCLPAFCFSDPVCFTSTLLFLAKEILCRSSIDGENYAVSYSLSFSLELLRALKKGQIRQKVTMFNFSKLRWIFSLEAVSVLNWKNVARPNSS